MSHLYYTVEPGVISEGLLHQCVQEQGPEGEAGRIARSEGIEFLDVHALRLDFKSEIITFCSQYLVIMLRYSRYSSYRTLMAVQKSS